MSHFQEIGVGSQLFLLFNLTRNTRIKIQKVIAFCEIEKFHNKLKGYKILAIKVLITQRLSTILQIKR